ncbi:MAG TPA: CBS domain-containing protein [Pseudonocardiaceae bacterium]|nr:CBS domain-containing protein [Pseudonocardiaceae bacterium]
MKHRTVQTIMTRDVVSALPDSTFKQIATLLSENGVSALPVTDFQGRVIGVVSEADLLRRFESTPHHWWRPATRSPRTRPDRLVATALMTTPAHTVGAETSVVRAARLLANRGIRRAPVVDAEGRLVGIVSRQDLVRVFVRPDEDIAAEIRDDVLHHAVVVDSASVDVDVLEGVVTLRGQLERASLVSIVGRLVNQVDGVVAVVNELTFAVDDSPVARGFAVPDVAVPQAFWGRR